MSILPRYVEKDFLTLVTARWSDLADDGGAGSHGKYAGAFDLGTCRECDVPAAYIGKRIHAQAHIRRAGIRHLDALDRDPFTKRGGSGSVPICGLSDTLDGRASPLLETGRSAGVQGRYGLRDAEGVHERRVLAERSPRRVQCGCICRDCQIYRGVSSVNYLHIGYIDPGAEVRGRYSRSKVREISGNGNGESLSLIRT